MAIKPYNARGKKRWRLDTWVTHRNGRKERMREADFKTKADAEARERQLEADAYDGRLSTAAQRNYTVDEEWEEYKKVREREGMKSLDTAKGRADHLLSFFGGGKVNTLTLSDVNQYREYRQMDEQPPQVSTINREVALLRAMLNHAAYLKKIRENPIRHVRMEKEHNDRTRTLSNVEFNKLYAAAEPSLKPILLFAHDTGMRKRSILDLSWDRVDVSEEYGKVTLRETDVKAGSVPIVRLTSRVTEMLKDLPRSISGYVFVNPSTDKPWDNIKKAFKRACEKAGIPHGMKTENGVVFHDLRRTFIMNASRIVDSQIVMTMSGHRTRDAFERYRHIDDSDQLSAVKQMEKRYAVSGSK